MNAITLPDTRAVEDWRYAPQAALAELWPLEAPEQVTVAPGETYARAIVLEADEIVQLDLTLAAGARAAVLDIPLLLETGGQRRVDKVVVVSAPRAVQEHRVRLRRRMSAAQIAAVIARQMPDAEKRRRADIVIRTGLSRFHALRQVRRFILTLNC